MPVAETPGIENYVRHWPIETRTAQKVADLPYLPVAC